ncbi:MAG: helix-turn-helix transcriptional regulator [Candidatus Obscuribacter sp.]|nr:helix-turn-helix transcriptional regulator [Candidatus Obscuribacter sp.]
MDRRSNCPIACTLDIIGDKWTLLVLRDLFVFKKSRFEQFLDSPEKIATNILTDRLQRLEKAGLVSKAPYGNHRSRMAYTLTQKGETIGPVLKEVARWGVKNVEGTLTPPPELVQGLVNKEKPDK